MNRDQEQRTPMKVIEEKEKAVEKEEKEETKPVNPFMNIFDLKRAAPKVGKEKEGIEDLFGLNKKKKELKPKSGFETGGKKIA